MLRPALDPTNTITPKQWLRALVCMVLVATTSGLAPAVLELAGPEPEACAGCPDCGEGGCPPACAFGGCAPLAALPAQPAAQATPAPDGELRPDVPAPIPDGPSQGGVFRPPRRT